MYDKLFLIFSKIFFEGEFEGVRTAFFARRPSAEADGRRARYEGVSRSV